MRTAKRERGTRQRVVVGLGLAAAVTAGGCSSATRQIERDQARIEVLARQTVEELEHSIAHLNAAAGTDDVGPVARPHLDQSIAHQRSALAHPEGVITTADRTRSRLVHVEDKVHPLVRLAQTWGTVALIAAVIALLAYLGVGPLIRRAFQMVGLLIPRAVRSDAKFDAETIASGRASALDRERIAARRATDPAYDRAFTRCRQQCEKESIDANLRAN